MTAAMADAPERRYVVPGLDRALSMLEHLGQHPEGLGASDLARALAIPKNSAFRIATTLTLRGWLRCDPASRRYRLSGRLLALGQAAAGARDLVDAAFPTLERLRDAIGETALLGVRSGDQGVVLACLPAVHRVQVMVPVGHRFSLHDSAPGKTLLGTLVQAEREKLIAALELPARTLRTITDRERLSRASAAAAMRGWSVDLEESCEDVASVAAPVPRPGRPGAVLWITGPAGRIAGRLDEIAQPVAAAARALGERLRLEMAG